jgi:hypothetical protein
MAEPEQVLMIDETREKTISTTKKDLWKWPKRKSGKSKSGVERLRRAVDKRVGKNSEKLADVLTEKALKGKLSNTRFLVGLAEGKKPDVKPKIKRGRRAALALTAEPEWVEPSEPDEENVHPVWVDGKWKQMSEGGTEGPGTRD